MTTSNFMKIVKTIRFRVLIGIIAIILYVGYFIYQYSTAPDSPKSTTPIFSQNGGYIDDASHLNQTKIAGLVKIRTEEDIQNALRFASTHGLKISIAGKRHSMGGQTFTKNGLVLDMMDFNHIELNKKKMTIKVQSGAVWADIQNLLDKEGLSVKAMQSINIFTVGGTLSVNAHGIAHNPGPISSTVRSMRIMLSNGEIVTASREKNKELFGLVIGGYGLFGVILDAEIEVVPNQPLYRITTHMDYKDVAKFYNLHIKGNQNVDLFYGRLSVSPDSYLSEMAIHHFYRTKYDLPIKPLENQQSIWFHRLIFKLSKTGAAGRWLRWQLEKHFEPLLYKEKWYKNQPKVISRNQEMYDDMAYLLSRGNDTDILQEYFLSPENMGLFIDGLKKIVTKNKVNLLNVTLRVVHKDTITALPYAKSDRFAFVLYFNQKLNNSERLRLEQATKDLIELTLSLKGTFYLPCQLYYSKDQLRHAYPEIDHFFLKKKQYDPTCLLTNKFYQKYGEN